MPLVEKYTDPTSAQYKSDANAVLLRNADISTAQWKMYNGNHRAPMKILLDGTDNNVFINTYSKIIDRTISFLFPDRPQIDIEDRYQDPDIVHETTWEDLAEGYVEAAWDYNGNIIPLIKTAIYGCLMGHNFVRVIPEYPYPKIQIIDPAEMVVYRDAFNPDSVLWYSQYWKVLKKQYRIDYIDQSKFMTANGTKGKGWSIIQYCKASSRSPWEMMGVQPWAFPYGPIVEWQHILNPRDYLGRSELEDDRLQNALNSVATDIKAILRMHAAPKTVLIGGSASAVVETSVDGLIVIKGKKDETEVKTLEMQSDLKSSMEYLNFLENEMFSETSVTNFPASPEAWRGITNLGIQLAFRDFSSKLEVLQELYGKGIKEISRRLLMLGGYKFDDIKILLTWTSAIPQSITETTNNIVAQRKIGVVSLETASNLLDYDYDTEQGRIAEEIANPTPDIVKPVNPETSLVEMPEDTNMMMGMPTNNNMQMAMMPENIPMGMAQEYKG